MSNTYRDAAPPRPVLLVSISEYLMLAAGFESKIPAPPGWGEGWRSSLVRLRRGQRPRGWWGCVPEGGHEWRDPTDDELRGAELLASIGQVLDDACVRMRVAPGPLPPLPERLAALEPYTREYAAARRRPRRPDPKQRLLFTEGGA